jgi:tRNA(fMet)-specific endonuclease VapC
VIFLLDTSAVSALMREDPRMATWLTSVGQENRVVICTIVRGEILFGLARLAEGRRRAELEVKAHRLLAALPCEAIPQAAGDHYANVKLTQQQRGVPLDENDLWLAATALAIGATVVSRDTDFQRIEAVNVIVP